MRRFDPPDYALIGILTLVFLIPLSFLDLLGDGNAPANSVGHLSPKIAMKMVRRRTRAAIIIRSPSASGWREAECGAVKSSVRRMILAGHP